MASARITSYPWYHARVLLPWIWKRRILPFLVIFAIFFLFYFVPLVKNLLETSPMQIATIGQNVYETVGNKKPGDIELDEGISIKKLEDQYKKQETLETEIAQLQLTFNELKSNKESIEKKLEMLKNSTEASGVVNHHSEMLLYGFLRKQEKKAEITIGHSYFYEAEVPIYRFFNTTIIYDPDNIVTENTIKAQKQTQELLDFSLNANNKRARKDHLIFCHKIGGYYRTEPGIGTQYYTHFCNKSEQMKHKNMSDYPEHEELNKTITRIILFRPFGPLMLAEKSDHKFSTVPIHLVMALSGRLNLYQQFISMFKSEVIMKKHNIYLTVVYFGREGLTEAISITNTLKAHHYKKSRLISVPDRNFSRSLGIEKGVNSWTHRAHDNVLTIIADVDIAFRAEFVRNCQMYAVKGKQVYFPIVFNQYNGSTVPDKPSYYNSLPLNVNYAINTKIRFGRWKTESYGILCTYSSDLKKMNMFDGKHFFKWGREDLYLYRKYVQSTIKVIRVQDPDIFHRSHWKECPSDLSDELFKQCLRAKGQDYSPHAELGKIL